MVNIELYRVFYTVAKCGSLTKAADELFISQPAVSQAIKQLESQLGTSLFNRTHRGMELSVQGGKRDIRYYSSAAWTRDQGIMLQNEVQKVTFRTKVDANLSKSVSFGVNVSANYQKSSRPRNNFIDFYRTPSFLPVYHNDWTTALTGYTGFARGSHFNNLFGPIGDPDEYGNPTFNTTGVSPFNSANNNPRSVMANTTRWSENFQGLAKVYVSVVIWKGLTF